MNLYWVTTPCGYENWFVVAESAKAAEEFHEYAEGFNENYAKAKLVKQITSEIATKFFLNDAAWPCQGLIEALGGRFMSDQNPRKVNFAGNIYEEGCFTEGIFHNEVGPEPGVYIINEQGSDLYKFGETINFKQRLRPIRTNNPRNVKIVYFIATQHRFSLEKHLKSIFKEDRFSGEWYKLDDDKLEELTAHIAYLQYAGSGEFIVHNLKDASKQGRVY